MRNASTGVLHCDRLVLGSVVLVDEDRYRRKTQLTIIGAPSLVKMVDRVLVDAHFHVGGCQGVGNGLAQNERLRAGEHSLGCVLGDEFNRLVGEIGRVLGVALVAKRA